MYRIFIVEDDPVIVSALCAHMEKWGFECRGVEDFRKVTEEFAAYDGGPWQEGMELAALPVFRNTTCMDMTNGFRTGGGDYAQLRRTMERLAAAAGADVAQAAVEARVPDETVQAAMEDAWAGETWQCGVTFAVRGGPTELALTWEDVTVTVGESGELWVKLSRPELASLTPDAAAAWLLEQYGAVFGEQTRYFMAAQDSGGYSLYFYRPEEDLTHAAGAAQAGFIAEKEGGMAAEVTARGNNLSGGQKQRLLIARALAGKPEILVLDDAASALDYRTDANLRHALNRAYAGVTTIIVAQRVSSLRHADEILVLDDGKVLGQGTHEHLMNTCPEYALIARTQMGEGKEGA